MEYIWSLEEELEDDDDDWNGGNPEHPDAECDYYKDIYYKFGTFETPDKWFAHQVERRALHLWREENKLMVQLGQGLKPPLESPWKICIFGRELIGRERSTSWIGL